MYEVYVTLKNDPNASHTFAFESLNDANEFHTEVIGNDAVAKAEGPVFVAESYFDADTLATALEDFRDAVADFGSEGAAK